LKEVRSILARTTEIQLTCLNLTTVGWNRPRYDSGGAEYTVIKNVQLGLTAGAVVYRKIDFEDAGFSPKIDPAPYVQLGAKVSF
jgi:hypothetical protein